MYKYDRIEKKKKKHLGLTQEEVNSQYCPTCRNQFILLNMLQHCRLDVSVKFKGWVICEIAMIAWMESLWQSS